MTVRYSASIATNSHLAFIKILFRWRGSIYRYIWLDFLIVLAIHTILCLMYSYFLPDSVKTGFEHYCLYCKDRMRLFPIHFVMGFFVDTIASRWWTQFMALPWPDELAMSIAAYTHGCTEYVRKQRRTIMRYINLSYVLAFRNISSSVKLRFPTDYSLISGGLATADEIALYTMVTPFNRAGHYSTPITWAQDLILQMREENSISSDTAVECLLKEIGDFRSRIAVVLVHDQLPIPLVYTQVATILVYFFTLSLIFAWQFLGDEKAGTYAPMLGLLHFFFYMGWLKVAESLINPFGLDADDFDIADMIERNMQISYHIVDEMCDRLQPLSRGVVLDTFAKDRQTSFMVHLNRVNTLKNDLFSGSVMNLQVSPYRR